MNEALLEWVEIRERIFAYDGVPPASMWKDLADAEHKLMEFVRAVKQNPLAWAWSEAQHIAYALAKK